MIVIFVSECEKNALKKTRQVLDSFAERIGNNTWKTRITMEGLKSVKLLLGKSATKQTAVACHRIIGYSSTELMWIVGNKSKFNSEGIVPTNYTAIDHLQSFENSWHLLPLIKTVTALASLFHDFGKASDWFQIKLAKEQKVSDPFRHEWISCVLLRHFIGEAKTDNEWLSRLKTKGFSVAVNDVVENIDKPLKGIPPIASMLMWLILTHHRMLVVFGDDLKDWREVIGDKNQILSDISARFNYMIKAESEDIKKCFVFSKGLPVDNEVWLKNVHRWSDKALELTQKFNMIWEDGTFRVVLHFARLALMLGDHYYSSKHKKNDWKKSNLIANSKNKQYLDEHLVGVMENALKITHSLPDFESNLNVTTNLRQLRKRSLAKYAWQNKAVEILETWRKKQNDYKKQGLFILNMASTGCGKTIANAKVMRCVSDNGDSLRYTLALGLRTLTLQTGDAYREKLGLDSSELGVIVGSKAIQELYEIEKNNSKKFEEDACSDIGSESFSEIFDYELNFDTSLSSDLLNTVICNKKHLKFLQAPIVTCTIDHLMDASESLRGGHQILPCLRLMSADLVIDEIDDFCGDDLIAISRLIYLAGMSGRKILLSSATIPPDLAYGLFNAYQMGFSLFAKSRNYMAKVGCAWVDEYSTSVDTLSISDAKFSLDDFKSLHNEFVNKRCEKLNKESAMRKGYIAKLPENITVDNFGRTYFEEIKNNILALHNDNYEIDKATGKSVSWGVVRMANITPCAECGKYLMNCDLPSNVAMKIMVYHSNQILLMRHVQEKYLDNVLNRNNEFEIFDKTDIRYDLNKLSSDITDLIYVVVASPVEEIGRDHDFDWAVIEPSSYRSIIQMAGRVKRHRISKMEKAVNNIAVMQYNYKGFEQKCLGRDNFKAFYKPGFEDDTVTRLPSHDLCRILDENILKNGINSIPRIKYVENDETITNSFVNIEHKNIKNGVGNTEYEYPGKPMGWFTGYWWLTGLPQLLTKFRNSVENKTFYLMPKVEQDENTDFEFCEKFDNKVLQKDQAYTNIFKSAEKENNIRIYKGCCMQGRLWLERDYYCLLNDSKYSVDDSISKTAEKYGYIDVSQYSDNSNCFYEYSPIWGFVRQKEG